jgi:hypothetical protein
LRARDEAAAIKATAERDAESIVAAATQRARATSAELLAATRRRLGDALPASPSEHAEHGTAAAPVEPVVDVTDDRPPPVKLGGWAVPPEGPHAPTRIVTFQDRRYRMNWERMPTDDDVEVLVRQAVSKAVARSFARRRRRRVGRAA